MIDPEFKKKWLAALRSGDYMQTKEFLHSRDGFCCLGVAKDIEGYEWGDPPEFSHIFMHDQDEELPAMNDLLRWGIAEKEARHLAGLNDGEDTLESEPENGLNYSFEEIADYIEKNL